MSSHYTIRKCALSSTVRGVRRRRYDARRARWYDARQANGATSFEPNGVTPFGPGGALRRSGRRSGDRPHSPAAVARQHAAKGNLAACPLCTSHRSARLRPARLHPARLHPGLDCRVDTDDDLFAKPSHGCHYSPETVSPKYKVQWPGWGPAEPVHFHILTRTESPLSSSFHRRAQTASFGQGYRMAGQGATLDKNDAVSEQHCHWCHCWLEPVTPKCKVRRQRSGPADPVNFQSVTTRKPPSSSSFRRPEQSSPRAMATARPAEARLCTKMTLFPGNDVIDVIVRRK